MSLSVPLQKSSQVDAPALSGLCLGYLAENADDLLRFMEFAGYDPASFRLSVGSAQLQRGLIDYFASNESILLALCANAGITPDQFMRVWAKLNPAG